MEVRTFALMDQQQMSVSSTAAKLPTPRVASGIKNPDRVIVQALSTNTGPIMLKNASDVASNGSTGGTELPAGSNEMIPLKDYQQIYAISAAAQKLQVTFLAGT